MLRLSFVLLERLWVDGHIAAWWPKGGINGPAELVQVFAGDAKLLLLLHKLLVQYAALAASSAAQLTAASIKEVQQLAESVGLQDVASRWTLDAQQASLSGCKMYHLNHSINVG
jgi:hypothetical protein